LDSRSARALEQQFAQRLLACGIERALALLAQQVVDALLQHLAVELLDRVAQFLFPLGLVAGEILHGELAQGRCFLAFLEL
jgi:hypothetical protein